MRKAVATKADTTRSKIIERSAPVFMRRGIEATSMSDIMEATKLAKGTLYIHFKNKDELAEAVVQYNIDKLRCAVLDAIAPSNTAYEKMMSYLDALSDALNPPVEGGCPMMNFGMEADDTNLNVKKIVLKAVKGTENMIADMIKEGIRNQEFQRDWNYSEFAVVIFAMIEGGIMISRVMGSNQKMNVVISYLKKMVEENRV